MNHQDYHSPKAAHADMSAPDADIMNKLKLWEEILDYLDRMFRFVAHEGDNNAEWSLLKGHQAILDQDFVIAELMLSRGGLRDEHGSDLEQLTTWQCQELKDTEGDERRDDADIEDYDDMEELRLGVAYQIRDELSDLRFANVDTARTVDIFRQDLAKDIARAEKSRDERMPP